MLLVTSDAIPKPTLMPWTDSPWRRVVVYGLGLSGRAAASWLLARNIQVVAFDQRTQEEIAKDPSFDSLRREPGLRLELGLEPQTLPQDLDWNGVDALILSPGVPADRPLVEDARVTGVPVLAEVELAFPFLRGTVLAITGSNGKSTTTALAAAMLQGADRNAVACGNIGEPVISLVDAPGQRTFVVELSSFQLESVELFHPLAAALLNVAADHLDRYDSLDDYRRAKLNVFRRQRHGDVAILNADDPSALAAAPELRARCRFFSRRGPVADGCFLQDGKILESAPDLETPRVLFEADDVPLPGVHQLENAMAAALLALAAGAEPDRLVRGLRSFHGLPHRLETVATLDDVAYYDDSKGTNPAAVVKSLEGFADGAVHLIVGGRFKGGDLGELTDMAHRKVARAYLIGESAERFARCFSEQRAVPYEIASTLDVAVQRAAAQAQPGQAVVLSPACSSFDQFANFAERGKLFQQYVRALPQHSADGEDHSGA
ncbi:MAG: UDP-N-acetylmuramoyl-L-alanine--D-glutamate ligase [Thermoanaerobaculia bacterium]|nr:UDP-N-acetylmuramoyl-L-alanine--D-glutamate ligase [Thermoanaerobaculia bacterium]